MKQRILRFQLVETLSRIWPYLKPEWRRLLLVAAMTLGLTVVEVSVPILVGIFVDSLLSELSGRQPTTMAPVLNNRTILVLLAVGALLRGYLLYQQRSLSGRIGQRVAARMRDAVWVHLQEVPLDYARRRGPGRLLVRFISDTKAVQRLVSQGMVQLIQDVLFVIGAIAVLTYLNLVVGLGTTLLLPLIALVFWRINPRVQQASRDTRNRRTRLSAHLNERLTGLAVVKIHGRQREEAKRVRKLNRNVASRGARLATAGGQLQGASAATVALVTALTLGLAAEEVAAGRLSAGYLVTSYALIGLLAPVVQRITIFNRTLQEAQISIERLAQTLAEDPESPQEEEFPEVDVSEGLVSVEGVSFSYPDGTLALDEVSLTAGRGELVALVGPNGAAPLPAADQWPHYDRRPKHSRRLVGIATLQDRFRDPRHALVRWYDRRERNLRRARQRFGGADTTGCTIGGGRRARRLPTRRLGDEGKGGQADALLRAAPARRACSCLGGRPVHHCARRSRFRAGHRDAADAERGVACAGAAQDGDRGYPQHARHAHGRPSLQN
jgi:hypothetical protein